MTEDDSADGAREVSDPGRRKGQQNSRGVLGAENEKPHEDECACRSFVEIVEPFDGRSDERRNPGTLGLIMIERDPTRGSLPSRFSAVQFSITEMLMKCLHIG